VVFHPKDAAPAKQQKRGHHVQQFSDFDPMIMSATLKLNWWLVGDDPTKFFPVKITNTESVGTLKKVIKEENQRAFHDIDACLLVLWKVSISVDRDLQEHLAGLHLTDMSQLSSVDDLLNVFPDLPMCLLKI
jgi:hypothetical protein